MVKIITTHGQEVILNDESDSYFGIEFTGQFEGKKLITNEFLLHEHLFNHPGFIDGVSVQKRTGPNNHQEVEKPQS